ncbi:photosystem II assembly protein [Chroococcidiopsis sp.]|uniref:photosystem II assembly protein n=1 Tax=Chroococcidiopsis sp. TaxID=3088168 RepID=UPI003F3DB150
MIDFIDRWWRNYQFSNALKQGNIHLAERLLRNKQNSGTRLTWLEKIFRDQLCLEQANRESRQEVLTLQQQLQQAFQRLKDTENKYRFHETQSYRLQPDFQLIGSISDQFKLIQHDEYKLQCTGIDRHLFDEFEFTLVEYLKQELEKKSTVQLQLKKAIKAAYNDIDTLKNGKDPNYNLDLTPHVYFIKYFLNNVYGAYLAWFLVYKSGLLPTKINILDIAAGPATMAYGLSMLLQSFDSLLQIPQTHICYHSLEKQASFQHRGLQFWRRYMEILPIVTNSYFRFDTTDIFSDIENTQRLPQDFFDFIVISHCFFSDPAQRLQSYRVFKNIFSTCLKPGGYVLLIVQGRKLFNFYDLPQIEDIPQELKTIARFLEDLELSLEWYNYATSTGKRTPIKSEFAKFATENLPAQKHMLNLAQKYLGIKHNLNYVLDDYIILAKKP